MFDNIGGKIKGYAKIIFAIFVIAGIIGAIATWILVGGFGGFMLFLVVGAFSIIAAYLSVMFIYAFGDLVENSEYIRKNTEEIYNINYETYSKIYDATTKEDTAPINLGTIQSTVKTDNTPLGGWVCKKCDTRNNEGVKYCKSCGADRQ